MRLHMEYRCYEGEHFLWIFGLGFPFLIVWVFGSPIITLVILYKNRNSLHDGPVTKYFLILYQGYNDKMFYWEFINTLRKFMILAVKNILSVFSIKYRILASIIVLGAVIRMQQRLRPYKKDINNEIDTKAMLAGVTVLYSGLLFEFNNQNGYEGFDIFGLILILIFNITFILDWTYMFLLSVNFKNENMKAFLKIFGLILCRKVAYNEKLERCDSYESAIVTSYQSDFAHKPKKNAKVRAKISKKKQRDHDRSRQLDRSNAYQDVSISNSGKQLVMSQIPNSSDIHEENKEVARPGMNSSDSILRKIDHNLPSFKISSELREMIRDFDHKNDTPFFHPDHKKNPIIYIDDRDDSSEN